MVCEWMVTGCYYKIERYDTPVSILPFPEGADMSIQSTWETYQVFENSDSLSWLYLL